MAAITPSYEIEDDLADERLERFRMLLNASLLATPFVYGLSFLFVEGGIGLYPLLFALTIVLHLFVGRARQVCAWIFVLAAASVPLYSLWTEGPGTHAAVLILLPVIAASLILDRDAVLWTGIAIVVAACAVVIHRYGLSTVWVVMPQPVILCLLLVVAIYWMQQSFLDVVHWATDLQQKDTRRAEAFYEQKQQLESAMLELKFANDKLGRMNDELDTAQRVAENASRAKSIFLSNMSHELRTPLNVIIGYSSSMLNMPQMFDNRRLPPAYRRYIQLVEESGHYLLGLINDVLDLSKIEAGKLELHPAPIVLGDMLRGVLTTSIALVKEKPLSLMPDFPDGLPLVWGDPMRVRQILLNLLSNAVKFTETGSVTLSARVEANFVRVTVTDTGIGISQDLLERIFERFQQATSDTERRYGGTGLGLDISRRLAIMHGSDLQVESTVNQGSSFSFTLPLATEAQIAELYGPALDDKKVTVFDEGEELMDVQTALVVEDETATRKLAYGVLEAAGYVVIETHEGRQALELAAGLMPDVILLDMSLPDMDGWEVLRQLKGQADTQAIPVVVFSAYPNGTHAEVADIAGYIEKPATADAILQGVNAALAVGAR
ncbi:MAG: response regulator [Anaerolineae bacterium]|nr:response regulator [Anaerolineae bacterium]